MKHVISAALGLFMATSMVAAPLSASAATKLSPAQREAKRLEVKRQKAQIRAERAVKGEKSIVKPIKKKVTVKPINKVTYADAAMGYEFASSLWLGYTQYAAAHNGDWPALHWFENIVSYNMPIYLNEKGFTLDSGEQNYFVWDNFSEEWQLFYRDSFYMNRGEALTYIRFELPSDLDTAEYGLLKAGVWYFTSSRGLVGEKEFSVANSTSTITLTDEQVYNEAWRTVEQVKWLRKALDAYFSDVRGYPVLQERAIELGENGATGLYQYSGFGPEHYGKAYMTGIKSGRPLAPIMYDSRYSGHGYIITFTIFATYDGLEPGTYEASPYGISKIADVKGK